MLVAACAGWHEQHETAIAILDERPRLVAHCALETYSALTRLPEPLRIEADLVAEFLRANFPDEPLALGAQRLGTIVDELVRRGISGGAAYDGLIALTAAEYGAELITRDQRAEQTYRRCGVSYKLLA